MSCFSYDLVMPSLFEGAVVCTSVLIFLMLRYVVIGSVYAMHFMFCFMRASVTFLCVLICVVYCTC